MTAVKPLVMSSSGSELILPLWTHPSTGPEDPELWAYWIWDQVAQPAPTAHRRVARRQWHLNLSIRCSLHTAIMHSWQQVATPAVRASEGVALPPCNTHLTYVISDFDEDIVWDRLCYPEIRMTSAAIVQHEATVSERSSSLIAASSSVTAIHQESLQVRSFNKDAKDFSSPFMEIRGIAERLSREFLVL